MTALNEGWFTEIFQDEGTAFSLKVKGKLHEEQTPFQKIAIWETETFGNLMTIDGCVMLTTRDNFLYHEMMAHPALFTHKDPRKVVIIGGGDCGTLREVLKHPGVEEAWQVDIDERVTRLSEQYFPELCESNDDPRANLFFGDGIQWMRDVEPESIDLIIVDSTDPVGPAEGLFAADFYRDCMIALREGGMVVQQSESPLLHADSIIRRAREDMLKAGFDHVMTLPFPQPVYPTGWWSCTMAGKNKPLQYFREEDADERPFVTRYYNKAIHHAALAQPQFMVDLFEG
ncbi:polyamine aminopropyltransferase [Hydrocarboniclastica marina]|uniref:Polyamine aminopropyltransferase n=1 Tax=Hydrocarboniclastica marina TaxID=2259620 RepID=A0A4P7XLP1_9ALTE|nr:polyamine aminopropyltransferase [Hydrocarboniclastica marina]MAL97193.1 spermidine synthase [Alteromonadaceae bacterium]QCF27342.1 polyamine aminopropyltransferase [Hydrocarboniclastica marina]|tara:strand:- start:264 stop:1124 length:861 start_codon:yes stop_codon:yes gene_type:complete